MTDQLFNNSIQEAKTNKIRLCIVTPNFSGGGAERIALNLAHYYTTKGIDTTLIALRGVGPYRSQISPKIKFIDLNINRTRYSLRKIYRTIKEQKPTHIVSAFRGSNTVLGIVFFFNKKKKLIYREANTMDAIKKLRGFQRLKDFFILKTSYLRANKIIANSADTKEDLTALKITHSSKITVIPNPVLPNNYDKLANEKILDKWVADRNYKIILNVGRLHEQKNQLFLIRAFATIVEKNKSLRLIILGSGDEELNLQRAINKLRLNDFVKIVPFQKNPWPYYKNADLFVLTSLWEGFGNVIVEALACGTPVVSTDCPGGPRFILDNGKYGTLVPLNDKKALQEAIMDIIEGRVAYDKGTLIQRGNEFSVDKIARRYLEEILKA